MNCISLDATSRGINYIFKNKEPWQIAAMTSTATLATVWLLTFIYQDESKYYNNVRQQKK